MTDIDTWADAAYDVLREIAKHDDAWITPRELMREVTERTGVATEQTPTEWRGQVLEQVADRCRREGIADLTVVVGKKKPRRD